MDLWQIHVQHRVSMPVNARSSFLTLYIILFLSHPWKFRQQQHKFPQEDWSACWRGQISYPSALFGVKLFIIDPIQQMNYVSNQGWMYTMNWPISKSLNLEGKTVGFRKNWKRTSNARIGMHSPLAFGEFKKSSHMSLYHLESRHHVLNPRASATIWYYHPILQKVSLHPGCANRESWNGERRCSYESQRGKNTGTECVKLLRRQLLSKPSSGILKMWHNIR